jgi:hypothetical protein
MDCSSVAFVVVFAVIFFPKFGSILTVFNFDFSLGAMVIGGYKLSWLASSINLIMLICLQEFLEQVLAFPADQLIIPHEPFEL